MVARVSGTFSGTGQSSTVQVYGNRRIRVALASGQATIALQRSIDGGTTWVNMLEVTANGAAIASGGVDADTESYGPCLLRLNCSAHTTATPYVLEATNVVS